MEAEGMCTYRSYWSRLQNSLWLSSCVSLVLTKARAMIIVHGWQFQRLCCLIWNWGVSQKLRLGLRGVGKGQTPEL